MTEQDGWKVVKTLDATGTTYAQAKPLIEQAVKYYEAAGFRVKIEARSIVDILIATDA